MQTNTTELNKFASMMTTDYVYFCAVMHDPRHSSMRHPSAHVCLRAEKLLLDTHAEEYAGGAAAFGVIAEFSDHYAVIIR